MFSWLTGLFRKPSQPEGGINTAPSAKAPSKSPPTVSASASTVQMGDMGTSRPALLMPRIEVEITQSPEQTTVRIKGDARVAEAAILESKLAGLLASRPGLVIFDLSQLNFISSLAMGVLVTCRRTVIRGGGQVRCLPELQEFVRTALGHAGLLEMLGIPPTTTPVQAPPPAG